MFEFLQALKNAIVNKVSLLDAQINNSIQIAQSAVLSEYEAALAAIAGAEHSLEDKLRMAFELGMHSVNPNATMFAPPTPVNLANTPEEIATVAAKMAQEQKSSEDLGSPEAQAALVDDSIVDSN